MINYSEKNLTDNDLLGFAESHIGSSQGFDESFSSYFRHKKLKELEFSKLSVSQMDLIEQVVQECAFCNWAYDVGELTSFEAETCCYNCIEEQEEVN